MKKSLHDRKHPVWRNRETGEITWFLGATMRQVREWYVTNYPETFGKGYWSYVTVPYWKGGKRK